jgi:hypothetical protein
MMVSIYFKLRVLNKLCIEYVLAGQEEWVEAAGGRRDLEIMVRVFL